MKNETEATESRYDPILNKIRENKLRNMKGRRVRLSVKRQGVLEIILLVCRLIHSDKWQ